MAKVKKGEVELTREMARVMETLADRESAIVEARITKNGELTPADLSSDMRRGFPNRH